MALTLTQLTGTIDLPNGETPSNGRIRFAFSQFGVNGASIFVPGPVEFQLSSAGALVNCFVQSTTELDGLVLAQPTVIYWSYQTGRQVQVNLPAIAIPEVGPVTLASLLLIPAPAPAVPDLLAQTLAAQAASAVNAEAAGADRLLAQDAAYQAGIYAGEALGVVSGPLQRSFEIAQSNGGGSAGAISAYWPNNPRVRVAVLGSGLLPTSGRQGLAPYNVDGSLNPGLVQADEISRARGVSIDQYIVWQGATPLSAWVGSEGITIIDLSFASGSGPAFARGDTLTWNSGIDGPAHILKVTDSGATGTMTVAVSTGKRFQAQSVLVGSGGKTAEISGAMVETALLDATHVLFFSAATGTIAAGQTVTWTGGAAVVLDAEYHTSLVGALVVRLTSGLFPANGAALTASGGGTATVGQHVKANLRWTVQCAFNTGNAGAMTAGQVVTWTRNGVASRGILTDAIDNGASGTVWIEVRTGLEPISGTALAVGTKTMNASGAPVRTNRALWNTAFDLILENNVPQFDNFSMDHGEAGYDWTPTEYKSAVVYAYHAAKELGTAPVASRYFPMIVCGLYIGPDAGQQAKRQADIAALEQENPGIIGFVPSRDLEGRDDGTGMINHLTNAGYLEKGQRRARKMLGMLAGDAPAGDQRLFALTIPGQGTDSEVIGHRKYQPRAAISADRTLLIENGEYLGQHYLISGAPTVTLDGDANSSLGDGGVGFSFFTQNAGDVITFSGGGRDCVLLGGDGALSPTIIIRGAGQGSVIYQQARYVIEFTPLANLKRRTQPDNPSLVNASVSVADGWFVRFTGATTSTRIISLTQIGAENGDLVRVFNATTGGFNLTVRDNVATTNTKTITPGTSVDFVHNGSAWVVAN